jgi:hypothetical protein
MTDHNIKSLHSSDKLEEIKLTEDFEKTLSNKQSYLKFSAVIALLVVVAYIGIIPLFLMR